MTKRATQGFTLIEVLVALSVLSIAVLAMVKVQSESAVAADGTRARLFAQIVAENRLVETISAPGDLVAGTTSGDIRLAGQVWAWTQDVAAAGDGNMTRIDVAVRAVDGADTLATLTGFRGRH